MEKAHDISIDEPCVAHQAILFMLDVLMRQNKQTMQLDELYDSFGDKSFTPQMLRAVGGNEQGLKQFLLRYPSLFTVNGDTVSANSGGSQLPRISTTPERYLRNNKNRKSNLNNSNNNSESTKSSNDTNNNNSDLSTSSSSSSSSSSSTPNNSNNDNSQHQQQQPLYESKTMKEIEQEAIAFFRKQISKREEDWLPIVSVAGHASQSSADVRKFVGPQNEFKQFLLKYPHIFVVRDEFCGLKGKADLSSAPFPPPSPPPSKRRIPPSLLAAAAVNGALLTSNGSILSRTHSFKNTNRYSACGNLMPNGSMSVTSMSSNGSLGLNCLTSSLIQNSTTNSTNQQQLLATASAQLLSAQSQSQSNKPRLTAVEVKAVHYVMRILHKNGRMLLQTIPGLISRAPDQVSNIVGFTREDLIQFFKRHSAIFQLHPDGCVSVKQDAVKALILKDQQQQQQQQQNQSTVINNNSNDINSQLGNSSSISNPGIITNSGVILRIFPKYGILNMDNNEQVFFDIQSCQFETFADLTTILHTGDKLYFNAIIGPRDGSTKWRSLKTWIKMKPQPQTMDNMSTNSDADVKSDDSSTSSSGHHHHNHHHSHHHNHLPHHLQHHHVPSNRYYFNPVTTPTATAPSGFTGYVPPVVSSPINGNGGSGHTTPISTSGGLPSSPTNLTVSTCIINGGASTNSLSLNSEFNQYQLELNGGDLNTSTNNDENNNSSNNNSNEMVHSSSTNNLDQLSNNNSNTTNKMSLSKTIHSFNNIQLNDLNKKSTNNVNGAATGLVAAAQSSSSASSGETVTKLLKQSPDNISEREVSNVNSDLISIGCQTISTGDIQLTNVYIE